MERNRRPDRHIVSDAELTRYLRALWPEVAKRVPTLRGARVRWEGDEVVVSGVRVRDPTPLEEKAELVLERLGFGEVRVRMQVRHRERRK